MLTFDLDIDDHGTTDPTSEDQFIRAQQSQHSRLPELVQGRVEAILDADRQIVEVTAESLVSRLPDIIREIQEEIGFGFRNVERALTSGQPAEIQSDPSNVLSLTGPSHRSTTASGIAISNPQIGPALSQQQRSYFSGLDWSQAGPMPNTSDSGYQSVNVNGQSREGHQPRAGRNSTTAASSSSSQYSNVPQEPITNLQEVEFIPDRPSQPFSFSALGQIQPMESRSFGLDSVPWDPATLLQEGIQLSELQDIFFSTTDELPDFNFEDYLQDLSVEQDLVQVQPSQEDHGDSSIFPPPAADPELASLDVPSPD